MARPREFDMEAALDGATREFWDKGFHGTTLPGLLKAMKLTRGSLYKAFGSKRAVYLAALKRYEDQFIAPAADALATPSDQSGKQRIRQHFLKLVESCGTVSHRNGCFMCKASVDMASHDKDVEQSVNRMLLQLEKAYAAALAERSRPSLTVRQKARQLTAVFLGLQVMRNAGTPKATVSEVVGGELSNLA